MRDLSKKDGPARQARDVQRLMALIQTYLGTKRDPVMNAVVAYF